MNKNAIATLTTAFKNVEAKNFTLNVVKNQKKNGNIKNAKATYWNNVSGAFRAAREDAKSNFTIIHNEWLKLRKQLNNAQTIWLWTAYNATKPTVKQEPNASVRITRNAALRVALANQILDGSISNNVELCNRVRGLLKKRNEPKSAYYLF